MKAIIFYRSSYRGNTLKIAQSMLDALAAELVCIGSNPSINLSDYDLIDFGSIINFATHDIRLRRSVSGQNLKGRNMFIFSTRCRPFLGAYHRPLKRIIEGKGGIITGEFSCRGFDRTGPWVLMDGYNKARPDERDMFEARLFAEKLRLKLHPLAHARKNPVEGYSNSVPIRRKSSGIIAGNKVVFLNTSTCINCEKCIKICPMHIFARRDAVLPIDEKNYIQCRLCTNNCPTSSIYIHESFLNGLRIAIRESSSDKLQNSYNAEDNQRQYISAIRGCPLFTIIGYHVAVTLQRINQIIKSMIAFFKIPTNDFDKSVAFYQTLFGEKLEVSQFDDEKMARLMKGDKSVCSISSTPSFPSFAPSNGGVLVYLQTKDLDASMKTALDNDATIVTPKTKIQAGGWGYFVIIADPVGNRIGLYGDK